MLLYGVGKARDEARTAVKKLTKEIGKLFSKRCSIDIAEGKCLCVCMCCVIASVCVCVVNKHTHTHILTQNLIYLVLFFIYLLFIIH